MPVQNAANASGRNNYIYREGVTPNTNLLNTQKVKVLSFDADDQGNFNQIGLVQSWNPTESRAVEPHRGIGFGDQIAELGVGVTDITATCGIMMMYVRDIMQVFGYKAGVSGLIRSLKHHRWPFDVKEAIAIPDFVEATGKGLDALEGATGSAVITVYEGCWLSDYSKAFTIGETATAQDTTMSVTDVYAPTTSDFASLGADSNNEESALYSL